MEKSSTARVMEDATSEYSIISNKTFTGWSMYLAQMIVTVKRGPVKVCSASNHLFQESSSSSVECSEPAPNSDGCCPKCGYELGGNRSGNPCWCSMLGVAPALKRRGEALDDRDLAERARLLYSCHSVSGSIEA